MYTEGCRRQPRYYEIFYFNINNLRANGKGFLLNIKNENIF